ncbi:MAG: hypothetical protein C0469_05890 [Cyanobacteria bacterium DS2.3.42]|nr:hypothetical protein [Cyanobacteria bacterium DS2.3.42]
MLKNSGRKAGAGKMPCDYGCNVLDRSSAMKNLKKLTKKKSSGVKILKSLGVYIGLIAAFLLFVPALSHLFVNPGSQYSPESGKLIFVFACTIGLLICKPLLSRGVEFRMTREKLEEMEACHSNVYSDDVIKLSQQAVEMPVALPVAWDCLKEATNGLDIKALDKRRASWLVDSVDDDSRTVRCSLQYMADPLGRKLSQIYPRTIEMVASVDGHGINTKLRTRYTFATPMDLEAVSEIISKTNSRLNEMIVIADQSVKEQQAHKRGASAVAQLEKPSTLNLDNLGKIDLPISLN